MRYPRLPELPTGRLLTNVFSGYDHRSVSRDGTFYDTENLTTDAYPALAVRPKRGTVRALTAPGGLIEKDALCWVDDGTLYVNGSATPVTGLSAGEKQLVSMGATICIFPDKMYYNTENALDYGSMEAAYTSSGTVTYSLCRADGRPFEGGVYVGGEEPDPENAEVWLRTGGSETEALSWSQSYGTWIRLDTVYTKLTFSSQGQLPRLFSAYDGVTVSGCPYEDFNGSKLLQALGGEEGGESDWIVLIGLLGTASAQSADTVRITRTVPDLDYVCEAQNRLWGCFYGNDGEKNVNEIYGCALGDFRNWRQYAGLSTDSWAASVGSDGPWTGAVNYLGMPVFFKENRIHQVSVSAYGAHQLSETVCRGVQKGSHRSLRVVNETLYYKSRTDVCAWQGGFPESVSEPLGQERYSAAVGGSCGQRYYLSMKDAANRWHLFVYDLKNGLWCREDGLHVQSFANVDDELYAIDADTGKLLALNGTVGTPETDVSWSAETGVQTWEYPDRKYLSRYNIRLQMAAGSEATVYLEYDSDGVWRESGRVERVGLGTVTLPIRPRRCDHLRFRIAGHGDVRILSIARILETGSDV